MKRKRISIFLVFFVFCTGIFFLLPQHATAIGETTLVQITGPSQPPGFSPALLTIHMYDTVVFVNQSTAPHAVSSTDGSFSSPAIPVGQQWHVTFSSLGAHEYHANDAAQHMVGEILVVANSVSLLPTPVPQVEATVIALIKAGKHPPDTIVLPVIATPPTVKSKTKIGVVSTLLSPSTLIIAGSSLLLLLLILLVVLLSRRRAKRVRDEEEMDMLVDGIVPKPVEQKLPVVSPVVNVEVVAPVKKRLSLLAVFQRMRSSDNDDTDEDEDEE